MGGIAVAGLLGEKLSAATFLLWAMLLGFVAYGLSIRFYIMAQYWLGAAKTSAFYSLAPFLGVGFSFVILRERPEIRFYIGLAVMAVATAVMIWDTMASVEEKGARNRPDRKAWQQTGKESRYDRRNDEKRAGAGSLCGCSVRSGAHHRVHEPGSGEKLCKIRWGIFARAVASFLP